MGRGNRGAGNLTGTARCLGLHEPAMHPHLPTGKNQTINQSVGQLHNSAFMKPCADASQCTINWPECGIMALLHVCLGQGSCQ